MATIPLMGIRIAWARAAAVFTAAAAIAVAGIASAQATSSYAAAAYGAGMAGNVDGSIGPDGSTGTGAFNPSAMGGAAGYGQTGYGQTGYGQTGYGQGGGYNFQAGVGTSNAPYSDLSAGYTPQPLLSPNGGLMGAFGYQAPLQPFTGVTLPGGAPAPLYARPGDKPGSYELFQKPPPQPSEFERYVYRVLGERLIRFGANLVLNGSRGFVTPATASVPPDYRLNPGDVVRVQLAGSVQADLNLTIDNEGRIFIPHIGEVHLAGIGYGDLASAVERRVGDQYKSVQVSATITHLHGLTVYVTGFAVSPGAYIVSSLSTMANAVLAAGGPSSGGSYRFIDLRRDGKLIATLDLYDLLLRGDTSHDAVLQNGDVIDIHPAGAEIAVTGSVNNQAIYEAKPGESVADLVAYAGGLDSLADRARVVVSRLSDMDFQGSEQLTMAQARTSLAEAGEIVRVLSLANVARPEEKQAILATIEGEVSHAGRYYLPPGSTLGDLLNAAGGLTPGAFLYGTALDRFSVKEQQREHFEKVIDDLKLAAATEPLTQHSSSALATDRQARTAQVSQGLMTLANDLRSQEPDGRLVLPIDYLTPSLPLNLKLENLDHIYIPPVPKSVGVYGMVYQQGAFLYSPNLRLRDYLLRAGGIRKGTASDGDIFVIRADGSVVSRARDHGLMNEPARPGDVVFVPVKTGVSAFERILEYSQLVYQYGVGLAAIALSITALGG